MAKRNTEGESRSPEKPPAPRTPKIEIDFESLIATAVAAVVVKPAKRPKGSKPNRRP
jgi:hypothetical protein